jgi:hypothetical protein
LPPTARRRPAFVFLIALLMSFAVGAVQAHAAQAATLTITPGSDPAQDKGFNIAVTGSTEVDRYLFAYVYSGDRLCAATASANSGGTTLTQYFGTYETAGSISHTYGYTASLTGTFTVCGYVASSSTAAPAITARATFTVRAATASLTLTPGPDPAEDKPFNVAITGTTEVDRYLFAYVYAGDRLCTATASANSGGTTLTQYFGTYEVAGAISHSYGYTPTQTGTHTVCAYVARSSTDTPDTTARTTFTVRRANASLTLTPGADPTQDKAFNIGVSGTTEVDRYLYAYVYPGTPACPATAGSNSGGMTLTQYFGTYEVAGVISHSYSYTPTRTGTHTVCSYVSKSATAVPDSAVSTSFSARRAAATATVAMSGAATQNSAATVTVTGTTEVDRYLYAYAVAGAPCPATAAANTGSSLTGFGAKYLPAGNYAETLNWYPSTSGAVRLCAYVTRASTDTPDRLSSLDVNVAADPNAPAPSLGNPFAGDAGGSAAAVPTAVALLGPAAQASAEHLNPTFRWQASADPDVVDTLRIQRNEPDGTTTKLMDATTSEYTAWEGADGEDTGDGVSGDTSEIATVSEAGGVATLQFKDALSPGEYSWFVTRTSRLYSDETDPVRSESRVFVVLGPHLRSLRVRTASSRGSTSRYPGQTTIDATTTPYARVKFAVRHGKRESRFFFHTDEAGSASLPLSWSCQRPGGVYRVTVTAGDQFGATRHKTASFHTVSRSRCGRMRRAEVRARRARERRRAAAQRAADRRAARRHAAEVRRYKRNCSAIGGYPTLIDSGEGMEWYCVGPFGGLITPPGF